MIERDCCPGCNEHRPDVVRAKNVIAEAEQLMMAALDRAAGWEDVHPELAANAREFVRDQLRRIDELEQAIAHICGR